MKEKEKQIYRMPKFLLLSSLCLVLTFVATSSLLVSLSVWGILQRNELPNAVASVHLENVTVDINETQKESLAQYILDNFVKDDRITAEQIEKILQSGDFTQWAGWMVSKYSDYLANHGEKTTFPELNEEDIVALIEENADLIYQETGLHFLEPDKEKLTDTLKAPIEEIDQHLNHSLNTGAGGMMTKFFLSWQFWTVSGILLIVLLIWEITIHKRGDKRTGSALQAYSIAGALPCLLFFLAGTCSVLLLHLADMPFLEDAVKAIRGTLTAVGGIGMLVSIALFVAGMTANLVSAQLRTEAGETIATEYDPLDNGILPTEETAKDPLLETVPPSVMESEGNARTCQAGEAPLPPAPVKLSKDSPQQKNNIPKPILRKYCRFCGKPLTMENALFCGCCGKSQIKPQPIKKAP